MSYINPTFRHPELEVNEIGYQSMTTPLTIKAFGEALDRFGTRSLATLLEPAIAYCEEGFVVLAVKAVADLAQADGTGHVLEFAVAVRRAGEAVERVVGDIQFHDVAP